MLWLVVLLAVFGLMGYASRDLIKKRRELRLDDADNVHQEWAKEKYRKRFAIYSGLMEKREQIRNKFNKFCENYNRLIKNEDFKIDYEKEDLKRSQQYRHLIIISDLYDAQTTRFQAYYKVICFLTNNLRTNNSPAASTWGFAALDFVLDQAKESLQTIESEEAEYTTLYLRTK